MHRKLKLAACFAAIIGCASAQATTVLDTQLVPIDDFKWAAGSDGVYENGDDKYDQWGVVGPDSGRGTATITANHPWGAGNGSLELSANGVTSSKIGAAYYPEATVGFGPLKDLTAVSFDWKRAIGSAPTDSGPVMRLMLFNAANIHVGTLAWEAINNSVAVTDDQWESSNVMLGKVFNSNFKADVAPELRLPSPGLTFAELMRNPLFQDLNVRAVEVGYGKGGTWSDAFVGAVDNVIVEGSAATVAADFEMTSYAVTIAAANGTALPASGTRVLAGQTLPIELTPNTDYELVNATGCGGTLSGSTFTTAAATADCTVTATFRRIGAAADAPVTNTRAVPTMNEWGLALLALLTAGAAALRLRRRR
ncbi:IPTL-CTERM sorting domain-containing protein [Diaphorobacter sp.]|uniref:IPTL-CTERM sorting domain-containing protein n=1 Tax=Diaphorobacter sp. TaxID=1934310 RepID=UPI0028AD2B9C|nr:IPTL-CTERM sorting domain-containing protein [Diaphorobacter sp.]